MIITTAEQFKRFVWRLNKVGRKQNSMTTTKSIPLLQPEHVFCQHNRLGNRQAQDWYPNEKMVVVPIYSSSPMVDLVVKGV